MKKSGIKKYDTANGEAVSEIISAVLMVSLVVVGIAVISVFIMGQDTPIEIPSLSMIPGTDDTDLLLYHSGGDSLKRGEFLVRVDGLNYYSNEINLIGQDGGVENANSWDSWDVGETLDIPGKSDYKQVLIISTVGGQESLITGSGEDVITGTGTPTATQTTTPGPVAGFTANITSGYAPLSVLFSDQSTGSSPTSWLWSFGDGGTSTGQNPVHEYSSVGSYNVSLTVSNAYGTDFEIKIGYINVSTIIPPAANFTASPTSGDKPLNVSFTDLSTGSPTSWFWEFGDGYNSTGQNPVHTYTTEGTYSVKLTVSNAVSSDNTTKYSYITVNAGSCTCSEPGLKGYYYDNEDFTGTPVEETAVRLRLSDNQGYSLYGYSSDIPDWPQDILGKTNTFSVIYEGYLVISEDDTYTFNLTSDDGSRLWIDTTDDSSTPLIDNWGIHQPQSEYAAIYLTAGYHPVKIKMYENSGAAVIYLKWRNSSSAEDFVTSFCAEDSCSPPVADFTADVTSGSAPLTVIFTDNSTGNPTSWLWDFGDGINSTEKNPSHTYSNAGTYDVSLKASNSNGFDYENKTGYITVTGLPNPAAWWRFDEASGRTVYDSSGNGNDGTIQGSYSRDTGACDKALYFDGTSTYVIVDDSDTLDAPEYITYAAWLKPEPPIIPFGMASTYNNYTSLIDKGSNDHDNYEFFIRRLGGTSQFSFETSTNGGTYREYSTTGLTYNYGEWQHIAFVVDTDSQTAKVYVNGQNTGTISSIQSYLPERDQDLTIGRQQVNNYLYYFYYKGYMDEVMLFTDALTDEQVLAIYDTCTPPVTVPVAEFTANQTEGETPFSVSFTDLSTGSPTSWRWDFGDGYNSTGQNPVHTYTSAGSYTVSLSASNSAGSDTEIKTDYITVSISFAEYIVSENVFVYGSQLSMDGRTITGEGSTIVIQDGGLKNSDLDGGTIIAVSNIYIDGPVTLIAQNGALGSPVSPGIIAVNGNVYLSYFGSIYGDLYIDGDLTLLGNTINGDIYVNGDLTLYDSFPSFGSADSKIYYTGALSCPAWWDSSKRSRFVKVDSVPIVGMPDMEIPSAKESDWYTSRGYVSGGTLESNMKIFANRYSSDFSSDARNIIIVAETGDINLDSGDYGTVTGVLFAPNGKVTFQGFAFEGVVIAKDGFFVKDGGTRVIFKNMDQYIVNPEDYPF